MLPDETHRDLVEWREVGPDARRGVAVLPDETHRDLVESHEVGPDEHRGVAALPDGGLDEVLESHEVGPDARHGVVAPRDESHQSEVAWSFAEAACSLVEGPVACDRRSWTVEAAGKSQDDPLCGSFPCSDLEPCFDAASGR